MDWRGRGQPTRLRVVTATPQRRRRSIWRVDGIDIRLPLLFVVPLAFVGGGILAPDPGGEGAVIAGSADVVGIASVIDGDTIEIHGRRIRFDGIDAPESSQVCVRAGAKERCGQTAAIFLSDMIGRQTVRCEPHDIDRYGRDISTCWLGGVNLNEAMVAAGQAVAYRRYSAAYVEVEDAARADGAGVWGTEFEMPWDYRR